MTTEDAECKKLGFMTKTEFDERMSYFEGYSKPAYDKALIEAGQDVDHRDKVPRELRQTVLSRLESRVNAPNQYIVRDSSMPEYNIQHGEFFSSGDYGIISDTYGIVKGE